MKIIKDLGFETLPMMSEFVRAIKSGNLFGFAMSETKDFQFDYAKKIAKELDSINEYADFITQPLTLSQFVPCKDGVPMEEPETYRHQVGFDEWDEIYDQHELHEYQQAVDAVIFEGNTGKFKALSDGTIAQLGQRRIYMVGTIESFINNGGKLKLK